MIYQNLIVGRKVRVLTKSEVIGFGVVSILLALIIISSANPAVWVTNKIAIEEQYTKPIDIELNEKLLTNISLVTTPIIGAYNITINTGHGVIIGDELAILEQNGFEQLYYSVVVNVVGDIIVLDSPIPFNFSPSNADIFTFNHNIIIDGSLGEQVFSLNNSFDTDIDITRFIFHITDSTAMDDSTFGGLPELTNGVVLRKRNLDGSYNNYFNVKNNGHLGLLSYDKLYDPKTGNGNFGVTVRITYAGVSKHGVGIKLLTGESIELVVNDDLTGLVSFNIMVQGHFSED